MRNSLILVIATYALISGCASNPTFPLTRPATQQQADITVFRESALIAGGVTLTVGADGKAFANIANGEKVKALLPAGEREIYVQARSGDPTKVKVNLAAGSSICLRTSSSPSTLTKVIIPITLMITGYHFYLDEVPCPAAAELDKYSNIAVTYQ